MEAYQKQADIVGQLSNSINKIFDSAIAKRNVLFSTLWHPEMCRELLLMSQYVFQKGMVIKYPRLSEN